MRRSVTVRFQDVTHKIASVVTIYEEEEIMARILNGINMGKLKKAIIEKIKRIAEENKISEFT